MCMCVFFTSIDRASTITSNIRGCQFSTWSAGQKKVRGTSTKLQLEHKNKNKTKSDKKKKSKQKQKYQNGWIGRRDAQRT